LYFSILIGIMSVKIHNTAIVSSSAKLGDDVIIREYAIIRDNVILEDRVDIGPHVLIEGTTRIGSNTEIFHSSALGLPPQDLKYNNEPTELVIGKNNTIREFVSIHRGTEGGGGVTRIGDNNLLMGFSHVAHDCQLGNSIILANLAQMGGHTKIGDNAIIGGHVAIHQFVHIGVMAMVGASATVIQDVPPYTLVAGNPAKVHDINRIGLRRKEYPSSTIDSIHKAITILCRSGLFLDEAKRRIESGLQSNPEIEEILRFIESRSKRGIMRGISIKDRTKGNR